MDESVHLMHVIHMCAVLDIICGCITDENC